VWRRKFRCRVLALRDKNLIGKEQDQVCVILARADVVKINRAPVLTLWAAVVAERLGYEWEETLTLGRAVAGLNAYKEGVSQGPCKPAVEGERKRPRKPRPRESMQVDLLHGAVPVRRGPEGLRALS